jgi:hypothetical protein
MSRKASVGCSLAMRWAASTPLRAGGQQHEPGPQRGQFVGQQARQVGLVVRDERRGGGVAGVHRAGTAPAAGQSVAPMRRSVISKVRTGGWPGTRRSPVSVQRSPSITAT